MPLVKLSFKSAKRYSNNPNYIQKVSPYKQYGKVGTDGENITVEHRTLCEGNSIPRHCIANMIAVLMGDRPYPKHRTCFFSDDSYMKKYYDIADRTFIKVLTDEKNLAIQQLNKEMYSAKKETKENNAIILDNVLYNLKRHYPFHSIIECALGNTYSEFDNMCKTLLGNNYKIDYTFLNVITELRKLFITNNTMVIDFVSKKFSTRIKNSIIDPIKTGTIGENAFSFDGGWANSNLPHWMAPNNTHGIETNVQTLCGEIAINATEEEIDMLKNGSGFATLMDGGSVTIESIDGYWTDEYTHWDKPV